MHIHILGIAGTFMSGLAIIAKSLGYKVTGVDEDIYPPISFELVKNNIEFSKGYNLHNMPSADLFIIGNALSRGNICVEKILNEKYNYTSGPQWLGSILRQKHVIAISGTHGKTTTTAMLSWILEYAGLKPSFLIAGSANNFSTSARITSGKFFIIEADEYDSAFFDKRSKFIHYQPDILLINNLEFDHADIFDTIDDIKKQFHHLIRTVPANGVIIYHENEHNIKNVLKKGCWSLVKSIKKPKLNYFTGGSYFQVDNELTLNWQQLGEHNMLNALGAIKAAKEIGISIKTSIDALTKFSGVKKRLEIKYHKNNTTIYEDFAHHPSAIASTIKGLRDKIGQEQIIVILELRSNTMKLGYHKKTLVNSLQNADNTYILEHQNIKNELKEILTSSKNIVLLKTTNKIISACVKYLPANIIIMSNSSFDNISDKLIAKLKTLC